MCMTHVLEIDAENPYQKTGTINRHENGACPTRYWKLIPEKFRIAGKSFGFPVLFFWRRFLASVSWA